MLGVYKQLFQVVEYVRVFHSNQCRGQARLAGATRAADAVGVVFDVLWSVIVDDLNDVGDIDTTTNYICSDENVSFSSLERVQRCLSCFLSLATVHRVAVDAGL